MSWSLTKAGTSSPATAFVRVAPRMRLIAVLIASMLALRRGLGCGASAVRVQVCHGVPPLMLDDTAVGFCRVELGRYLYYKLA